MGQVVGKIPDDQLRLENLIDKTESYSVLLIGTSVQVKFHGNVQVASRTTTERVNQDSDYSASVLSDLENMKEAFLSKKYPNCDLYEVWSQQRRQGRKEMLETIHDFFAQSTRHQHILYYSGHAEKHSGNWVIGKADRTKPEIVRLQEILSLWRSSRSRAKELLIIADSCYSGEWVRQLTEVMTVKNRGNVNMVASCGPDERCTETSTGGHFTKHLLGDALQFHPTQTKTRPLSSETDSISSE